MAASASNSMETLETKRTSKCPGCGVPGIPSKFCEGEEKSSPQKQAPPMVDIDAQISGLEEELASLEIEEQLQAKQRKLASLQRSIEEKRAKLQSANQQDFLPAPGIPPANIMELKQKIPETPLDGLLQPLQQAGTSSAQCWQPGVDQTMAPQGNGLQQSQLTGTSEMFLKPAQLPKGERILRIVDFVDNIVPRDDERTISDGGNTKLIVSYGPKKPKLEQVSLQQWVVSNTRIFYNLLATRKLQSYVDIPHYLAYTIKIMELANRFQWVSVLKYDD
ncbi:hypothetical protein ACROYT_G012558 [Oculina patagonica]